VSSHNLTPEAAAVVREILTLCLTSERNEAFFRFSPHVSFVEIWVYDGKWTEENRPAFQSEIFLRHHADPLLKLVAMRDELARAIATLNLNSK
jgi:hypothetical protein